MSFIDPELPDDAGEMVEADFADEVEVFAAVNATMDVNDSELNREAFADRVMEVIKPEDLFEQD